MFFKLFFLVCTFSLVADVENSLIPLIENYETCKNLPIEKYSKNQFLEIKEALLQKKDKIRLVSYNLLFDLYDHNLPEIHRWPTRKNRVLASIKQMQPDLMGVQELYPNQLKDLLVDLEKDYIFVAKPCRDGELNGIFFKKKRFELLDQKVFYMTDTPEVPSSETLTMVLLKDRLTKKSFALFNTHLAFSKIDKREFQVRFIAKTLAPLTFPLLLTGDLNTFSNRLDLEKLPAHDGDYLHRIFSEAGLKDARELSLLGHLGPISTFTNLDSGTTGFQGQGTPGIFLDHIYVSKGITVLIHAVEPSKVDGNFPSDHMPILIDFYLQ